MFLIIDGYNLLKNITKSNFVEPRKISSFVSDIVDYAKIKQHEVLIVFDGGSYDRPVNEKKDSRVSLLYTGYRKSADDVIKDYLNNIRNYDILVVTSDREINLFAQDLGINSIDSDAFAILLNESKSKPKYFLEKSNTKIVKLNKDKSNKDLDDLMEEGSKYLLIKDNDKNIEDKYFKKSKTLSRHEKNLLKISKKL